jgi:hypothetical protein
MSSDGKYQFVYLNNGELKYSSNFGGTWYTSSGTGGTVLDIAVSATGQYVSLVVSGTGIYISNNYGVSFINAFFLFVSGIASTALCMSANGQFQLAVYNDTVKYSENYGRNWYASNIVATGSPTLWTIACSSTGGYVSTAGTAGKQYSTYDVPPDVRQLVAGTGVTLTNDGLGTYTINASGSSPSLYNGAPVGIGSIGGFTSNQYVFGSLTWDFVNYNYDIEFVINQIDVQGVLFYWSWDNNIDFNNYQVQYTDWDGNGFYVGGNAHSALMYTQNANGFQGSWKGTLRALPNPSPSNYNRLMLEGTMSMNYQATGTRGFSQLPRSSRTISTYAGATQNSITQFNGLHSFSLWANGSNYASSNLMHMRVTKVLKGSP